MRVLVLTPRTNNVEPILAPLRRMMDPLVIEYDVEPWANVVRASRNFGIAVYFGAIPTHHGRFVPGVDQLGMMACPMVHICFDAIEPDWQPFLKSYKAAGVFRRQITIDGVANKYCDEVALPPVDQLNWPVKPFSVRRNNAGVWCHPNLVERNLLFKQLDGLGLLTVRARSDAPYREYQKFMCDCRAVVNMPASGSGKAKHVKARVVEAALAGAVLIEQVGSPVEDWFSPGVDYLSFLDTVGAAVRIRWVNDNPQEAEIMAERMRDKVLMKHAPDQFWQKALAA